VVTQRSSVWDTLFANTKDELVIDMIRWQGAVTSYSARTHPPE
jgi:hypothetical protein